MLRKAINKFDNMVDQYDKAGYGQPIIEAEADPVQCAIDGPNGINKLFACSRNATSLPIGFNLAFMAGRCSKNWDGYCDMYAQQEGKADETGKKFTEFIRECLLRMVCKNDTSVPGSQCYERCEMYNPMSSSSAVVCQTMGDVVFRAGGENAVTAISTDFPQSGRLQTSEPVRITSCPKVCNVFSAELLSDKNIPLNIALDKGIAMDLVQNLVENIVSSRQQALVTNGRLLDFMNKYVMDGSVKPGFSNLGAGPYVSSRALSVPAVSVSIPPYQPLIVNENPVIVGPLMRVSNTLPKAKEGFYFLGEEKVKKVETESRADATTIGIVIVVFILLYTLLESKK
jgi:hypothetical protein